MKVLIIGKPKSGTSMLAGRIKAGLDSHFNINSQLLFEPRGDWKSTVKDDNVTKILYSPNPNHLSNSNEVTEASQGFDKKVIICRDPRDIVISDALYRWFKRHNPKEEHFQKALDLVLQKEKDPDSVNLHEISRVSIRGGTVDIEKYGLRLKKEYDKFAADVLTLLKEKWFSVKYENIMSGNIEHLNKYLGFEISKDIKTGKKAFFRTARSKSYGNWRNWFTQNDIAFFKDVFKNSLELLEYDPNDWELNSEQEIQPKTSSEYMKNLFQGDGLYS